MYIEMMQNTRQKKVRWEDVDKECLKNLIDLLGENKDYFSDLMQVYGCRLELNLYKPQTEITKYKYTLINATKTDIEHIIKELEVYLNER